MKKFLIKFLTGFTLLVLQTTSVFAFYADVPTTNQYYNSIKALYELGRLPVESDNNFHPDEILTKGELYKLIITDGMETFSENIDLPFTDISNDSPYAKYIQTALDNKIIKAESEKSAFGINKKVTKLSTLTAMFTSLGIGTNYFFSKTDFPFTDISVTSDFAPLADKAAKLNIIDPISPNQFLQNKRITKAEAADYLYKIKQNIQPSFTITLTKSGETGSISSSSDLTKNKNFSTLIDVWATLKNKFLYKDKITDDQLIYGAIKGMVDEAKDKYTVFYPVSEIDNPISDLLQKFEGVGMVVELIGKEVTIQTPLPGSPAEKVGIQGKDIITKIDEKSVEGLTLDEVIKKIRGPAKSTVKITILRAGKEMKFTIVRDVITLKRVNTKILKTTSGKTIDYISLTNFGQDSAQEFATAAKDLIQNKPDGIILDLRNNPGGLVNAAIDIISLFTDQKKTALKMEYVDKTVEETKTNGNGLLKDYKVVILINEGAASASEIVAGALKDFGIATLVGKKSYGKGVVQAVQQYRDGSYFKYTEANWLTPNGTSINDKGLSPDVIVEKGTDPKVDAQLNSALSQF
jgi:carboxyl-terminal processing protease